MDRQSAVFVDSTHSDRNIFISITIALIYSGPMYRQLLKTQTSYVFLRLNFKKLSHFCFEQKDNANGTGGGGGSLVLLLFTRFSWHRTEISLYGSSEVYRSWPDVFGRSAHGPMRTFSDAVTDKGLNSKFGQELQSWCQHIQLFE